MKHFLQILTISLLAFIGFGAWAVASPVGSSPDEDYHLVSIWCSWGERENLCINGPHPNEVLVSERLSSSSSCFAHDPLKSGFCTVDDQKLVSTDRWNSQGEYPPLFYKTLGLLASKDVTASTLIMRFFNVALFVGLFFIVLIQLSPGKKGPLIWTGIATMVPLGVFLIASVNPSSWAIIAGLLLWLSLYGFITSDTRSRKIGLGITSVILCFIGSGARGDSAVFVALSALIAIILTAKNSQAWYKKVFLPVAIIFFSAFMFINTSQGTQTARSALENINSESSQSASEALNAFTGAQKSGLGLFLSNLRDIPWLWTGGTGTWGLGWLDTPVAASVWVGLIGVLFALFIWGLNVIGRRKSLTLLLALFSITAFPLYVLQGKGLNVGEFVQPRYLLPLLIITITIALFGFTEDSLGLNKVQSAVILGVVVLANSLSLHSNMRRYITGVGEGGINLNSNIEWWWQSSISPMTIWIIGSLSFLLMLFGTWIWLYPITKNIQQADSKIEVNSSL